MDNLQNLTPEQLGQRAMTLTTQIVIDDMTDDELLSITLPLQLGRRVDNGRLGTAKIEPLLTQNLTDGSRAMHSETKEMFVSLALKRLSP